MILGVAGPNAAGKGEVIRLLEERGFEALSLSDVIREFVKAQGQEETRERMIEAGTRMRSEGGDAVLAQRVLERLRPGCDYAIDSIRHPAEVAVLKEAGLGFRLLWVDAPIELRFERLRARGRSGDPRTLEKLRELEALELASEASSGQQLIAVRERADVGLENGGGLENLTAQISAVLAAEGTDRSGA